MSNHFLTLAQDELKSLQCQQNYATDALTHDLEPWERKEYGELVKDLDRKIDEITTRIEAIKSF